MIRAVAFDLDGVLFDGCDLHANLFLEALRRLRPDLTLTREYHDVHLNALSTRKKLDTLGVSPQDAEAIFALKQQLTQTALVDYVKPDQKVIEMCATLTSSGYILFCVSNSIRSTVHTCLRGMGVYSFFRDIVSNEDTAEPKPSPEPYLTVFRRHGISPTECLIVEDSPRGIESARATGAHVLEVRDCSDVTLEAIRAAIAKAE
jgi:HAD superfamily hydrolase (TIGR01509 family)